MLTPQTRSPRDYPIKIGQVKRTYEKSEGALPNRVFGELLAVRALPCPYRKGNSFLREMFDLESNSSRKVPQLSLLQKIVQLS